MRVKKSNIFKQAINYDMLADDTIELEIAIPIVVDQQSTTSDTLTTLNGYAYWSPDAWTSALINKIYVELEYETAGAGDFDLYNITDGEKLADLVAPTSAVSHVVTRYDVTSAVKALTADKRLGIQIAGDGTNAATCYSAKLIVQIGIS